VIHKCKPRISFLLLCMTILWHSPSDTLGAASDISTATSQQPRWVERPLEPAVEGTIITRGRGMHILGFVPRGGIATRTLKDASQSTMEQASSRSAEGAAKTTFIKVVSRDAVHGPSCEKNGRGVSRPIFEHGNYDRYYGYRHASGARGEPDPRLCRIEDAFGPGFFASKEVLDIGCNTGFVSLALGQSFGARRVVGLDIDSSLIATAEEHRKTLTTQEREHFEFRAEDILTSRLRRPPSMKAERFDVIICFSMTKWIHFNHGDVGIRNLFRRCLKRLKPGGFLVLEPQDWKSYLKKRFLTSEIRETVRGIGLKPEDFGEFLLGLGFKHLGKLDPPKDGPSCFKRTVYIYQRQDRDQGVVDAPAGDDQAQSSVELAEEHPTTSKRKLAANQHPKAKKQRFESF